ncbi:MAG: amino acid racemase, partial [Desulfobacterales bacterium]|nr:amino acid racemase [Desulfobacterales bacterium]
PSRIKALIDGTGESPMPCLQGMARQLESLGVDFLAMPCNTAHYFHRDIQEAITIPLLDMVELSTRAVIKQNPDLKKVGLLASTAVIYLKIYERRFAHKKISLVTPTDIYQSQIMDAIKKIKTSNYGDKVVEAIQSAADNLIGCGAEVLLVACTELSIIGRQIRSPVKIFDSAQILAESIIREARKTR